LKDIFVKAQKSDLEHCTFINNLGVDVTDKVNCMEDSDSIFHFDLSELNSGMYFLLIGTTVKQFMVGK